ncbi:DnaA-like protein [Ketogulonicigenium robustum]|uniref:DnaA-like protein n=1 Tax=Ketogulonicigenium robustum TaxID=92947 RepID=A0A1W6NXS6_9RHOB|nr:DnaA/Hda family protein [Ketogulonicigenium robustum]ARO13989.1 DnaA-like protein [Ketogulonicigenium robustum]
MPQQLSFDLPVRPSLAAGDYVVSEANEAAYVMVCEQAWPVGKMALIGAPGAGKTHLARVWQAQMGGHIWQAGGLDAGGGLPPDGANLVIEDMERLPRSAEEYVFHVHNHILNTGGQLLVTSDRGPGDWAIRLPDLASRMQAMPAVSIGDPDEWLMTAVLAKLFADRQLVPTPDVIPFLVSKLPRSLAIAADVVAQMDAAALAHRRPLNRPLARQVLDNRAVHG